MSHIHKLFFLLTCIILASCTNSRNSNKLTPEEWLKEYNSAWIACFNAVPQETPQLTGNFFNPDEDISMVVQSLTSHEQKVQELMRERYPELCAYLELPEYRRALHTQGQEMRDFMDRKAELEKEMLDRMLREQIKRNEMDLQRQREWQDMILRNYSPPNYGYGN